MSLLDTISDSLADYTGSNLPQNIFEQEFQNAIPPAPAPSGEDQPVRPEDALPALPQMPQAPAAPNAPAPGAPATPDKSPSNGVQWIPGVGFVNHDNSNNAGQKWQAAAGSPAPNLAAIQRMNGKMLDPAEPAQSTVRFYTRKLARATFMSPHSSVEDRMAAHADLRAGGTTASAADAGGLWSRGSSWNNFFVNNDTNDFGAGRGARKNQELAQGPAGLQYKYLTDLS